MTGNITVLTIYKPHSDNLGWPCQ